MNKINFLLQKLTNEQVTIIAYIIVAVIFSLLILKLYLKTLALAKKAPKFKRSCDET